MCDKQLSKAQLLAKIRLIDEAIMAAYQITTAPEVKSRLSEAWVYYSRLLDGMNPMQSCSCNSNL